MNKAYFYFIFSFVLLVPSCIPMFNIIREDWISKKIADTYEIHHAYKDSEGFENVLDAEEIKIDDVHIKILEERTPSSGVVKAHLFINGVEVSTPDEILISNDPRDGRYFSWLDVLTVKNKISGEEQIYFLQRITSNGYPLEERKWKIISINKDGSYKEESFSYATRNQNYLGVALVNFSNTDLKLMGYHSDINGAYPSIFFPIIYPIFTSLLGIILLIIAIKSRIILKRKSS
ncbi:hypothetical protein [Bacillus sp. 166amftsu]|uniref:hypothetical protein n=1 Tax=Bacillus sp. 166amftsu TaxID=1761753 RepID=UPI00089A3700|nr:hypothetical protein [Bacillus sp. 166amftsu]SDY95081.1 hypothetical protein SAMN04488156_103177 [Bacillus sp. 166amftsu]